MKAYVFMERPLLRDLLQAVLPSGLLDEISLVPTGSGGTGLASPARTILLTRRKPVAIFLETYSVDARGFQENVQGIEELVKMASRRIPTRFILLIPEMEAVFFQAPGLIARTLGEPLPDEVRYTARFAPKEALARLFALPGRPKDLQALIGSLTDEDIEALRTTPPIHELIAFLQEAAGWAQKATSA